LVSALLPGKKCSKRAVYNLKVFKYFFIMTQDPINPDEGKNDYTNGDMYFSCHVERASNLIHGKWKILILYRLSIHDNMRYNALKKILGTVSEKMLIQQLKELESDGLVIKTVYPVSPPKVEYSLTKSGKAVIPVITALRNWGCFLKHDKG
jgi:DNA-binding HxlR family transcriptional regulator